MIIHLFKLGEKPRSPLSGLTPAKGRSFTAKEWKKIGEGVTGISHPKGEGITVAFRMDNVPAVMKGGK